MNFAESQRWAEIIFNETEKDLETIRLGRHKISREDGRLSAQRVAEIICQQPMESLEGHSLGEIQNWRDQDELVVVSLRQLLSSSGELPGQLAGGIYAAHVVAAAVMEAVSKSVNLKQLMNRMLQLLKQMHDRNPSWGPLYVRHPGDIRRLSTYYKP